MYVSHLQLIDDYSWDHCFAVRHSCMVSDNFPSQLEIVQIVKIGLPCRPGFGATQTEGRICARYRTAQSPAQHKVLSPLNQCVQVLHVQMCGFENWEVISILIVKGLELSFERVCETQVWLDCPEMRTRSYSRAAVTC